LPDQADNDARIEEYRRLLSQIMVAFQRVPFRVIVETTLNRTVHSVDLSCERDFALVEDLRLLADSIAAEYLTTPIDRALYRELKGSNPRNFRVNAVSGLMEIRLPQVAAQLRDAFRVIGSVESMRGSGYPDARVTERSGQVSYLEVKATTRPDEGSPRDFYFTGLQASRSKVLSDGRHILLSFVLSEPQPGVYFSVVGWKLVDLSRIRVSLKPEFNADNLELYKPENVIAQNQLG
jgi:hypothetical protein